MVTVSILGSTGVIGRLTLDVIERFGERYRVRGLAAGRNIDVLANQIRTFRPDYVSVFNEEGRQSLIERLADLDVLPEIGVGEDGLVTVASLDTSIVVSAIVGVRGLLPTWTAIQRGATIALANKETLVAGGNLVMPLASASNARILPVDSEHSALFQCLLAGRAKEVDTYWLTASGGPFRTWKREAIQEATVEQALRHPTWTMGQKITIDSATLMNKGLEVIEAHHLFQVDYDRIKIVVHPQSIVHSMVEYQDGSFIAQLGTHDMRLPIQYALTYPHRTASPWPRLQPTELSQLTFEPPDFARFPCIQLAYQAGRAGGYAPCVLNAANEVAVAAVLERRIRFSSISPIVETVLASVQSGMPHTLEDIIEVDDWARKYTETVIQKGGWSV